MLVNIFSVFLLSCFCVLVVQAVTAARQPAFIEDLRKQAVKDGASSRVVAGWPAQDGQIPYQISLRMINTEGAVNSCGGSVIHHSWVITAAHCLVNRYNYMVRIGLTNLTMPEYILEANRRHIHPRYHEVTGGVQLDDIGLLGLDYSVPYGPNIQPCRLQSSEQKNDVYTGVVLTVSGYGLTDDVENGGAVSEILYWVHLRGIANEECRAWFIEDAYSVQEQTVCAEFYNDTAQSACSGDSGGPLTMVDFDAKPTMVGIVSFGASVGCNSPFPTAYVRPGHYHDWLRDITGINFDWTRQFFGEPDA